MEPAIAWLVLGVLSNLVSCEVVTYHMFEDQAPGTLIGRVAKDSGLTKRYNSSVLSRLTYKFLQQPNQDTRYFRVDEQTGELRTARVIDRDNLCPFRDTCTLSVDVAVSPAQYFQVLPIVVEIQDINDHSPYFPETTVHLQIPESTPPMSLFSLPAAEDPDAESNSVKSYTIQAGPQIKDKVFGLKLTKTIDGSHDLQLVVLESLDRERKSHYSVTVVATDGGSPPKTGVLYVNITVTDVNDHKPVFSQSSYNAEVAESVDVGVTVLTVQATDDDIGANGKISYSFSSKSHAIYGDLFGVDPSTGEIYTHRVLDYEEAHSYALVVIARDSGSDSRVAQTNVFIDVLDVNDNVPQIIVNTLTPNPYAQVVEHSPSGTFVAHVSVVDRDSGEGGQLSCGLLHQDYFDLENIPDGQFKVVTKRPLDREIRDTYQVTLSCQDRGEPSLSSQRNLTIRVTDANDHSPVFTKPTYAVELHENNLKEAFLLQVTASDEDVGANGFIHYKLGSNAPDDLVSISAESGAIKALQSLDHERTASLHFKVVAFDHGKPRRSSSAVVDIIVVDLNDEPPRFTQDHYTFGVQEHEAAGSSVGFPAAVDDDSAPFDIIKYSLRSNGPGVFTPFKIDPVTNGIVTTQELDRERQDTYLMQLVASNPGFDRLVTTASVTVHVMDINDHAPVVLFPSSSNNTVVISNMVPIGYVITRIRATDEDTENNAKLSYFLLPGDEEEDILEVDAETGALIVKASLAYMEYAMLNLSIEISDNGQPRRSSECQLHVVVSSHIMYRGPGMAEQDAEDSSLSVNLHSNIVIIVGAASAFVILVLVVAILVIHMKDRRAKALQRYNCRLEAQRMLTTGSPSERADKGMKPHTYQNYAKINSPGRILDDRIPEADGSLEGSRTGSMMDGEHVWQQDSTRTWPHPAQDHTQSSPRSTSAYSQRASPLPANPSATLPLRGKAHESSRCSPAHVIYPTGHKSDRPQRYKETEASLPAPAQSASDSPSTAGYKTVTFQPDKHDANGSQLQPLKDRVSGYHGNGRLLSPRSIPPPCQCAVPALPSRGDIPLGSFKPQRTISHAIGATESPVTQGQRRVLETDIDTGFSTVKKAPKAPVRVQEGSRDSGCYSNGDINKDASSPDSSYDTGHYDTMRIRMANLRESTA
ncbi:hypothetical protein CAPTEDRAFT_225723 [Capitella teleta]|uniref:Cadherin domain-containing protein n=1 Tax=Capitella teleta TaxID=283909 RepID=R7US18_CAPTE|nr:hypothetical protein CAPTEDRAFT_225723 [Capitella teleta]|eukprot:ELU08938.1 hypothetical protein CAPTEDRAFT_225723 [Capitella teleta]